MNPRQIERRVRWYQQALHKYLVTTPRARAIEIAHRRWGKDEIAMSATCELAHQRVASYWHCLPEYAQARKALWTAVNAQTGKRRMDEAFPPEIRESTNEQEMFIRLKCGSTWQLIGSDRYDATVGAGPAGIVYSEWALGNPSAWAYHRPMLEENDGWALFITTPRGQNHAKTMFDMAQNNPRWFAERSPVSHTKALSAEQLVEAKAEYISLFGEDVGAAQYEQEYDCSFNAAILGAYFGREMAQAEAAGRICEVPVDEAHPVHTAWDLGKAVNNPIWCFQVIQGWPRIVDFYRPEVDDVEVWVNWLNERGYDGIDYVPHDATTPEWGTGRTRIELLRSLKRKVRRIPRVSLEDGRTAARETIKVAVFDKTRCELGIDGLKQYRREWDDQFKTFRDNPVKDWAEHIGSAFRYLGLAWKDMQPPKPPKSEPKWPVKAEDGQMAARLPSAKEIIDGHRRKQA